MRTEYCTQCPSCASKGDDRKGDNLKYFLNDSGRLTNKCVKCGYRHNNSNAKGNIMSNTHTNNQTNAQTTEHYNTPNQNTTLNTTLITNGYYTDETFRGISPETGKKYLIQNGELNGRPIHIYNYVNKNKVIVAQKIRFLDQKDFFWKSNSADKLLFGANLEHDTNQPVYITEGECFPPEVEVLTKTGWKQIKDVNKNDEVVTANCNLLLNYEKPLGYIKKEYDGKLLEFVSGSYKLQCTPNHNLIRQTEKGLIKVLAKDNTKNRFNIPRTGNLIIKKRDELKLTEDQLRLVVMVSADFTIRKGGDLYANFRKERKVQRAVALLNKLNLRYSANKIGNGYTSVYIHRNQNLDFCTKLFNMEWLSKLNYRMRSVILEEVLYWDGNSVPNRNQIEYSSKELNNCTFIQTLAHLNGYVSTIMPRQNKYGKWYKVSILHNKKTSSTQKGYKEIDYKGNVYCLTVSTGKLLVRYKNSISICGNCDAASIAEVGLHSLSISSGAGDQTQREIEQNLEFLNKFEKIIFVFDSDEVGQKTLDKIVRLFKPGKALKVVLKKFKDANEYLKAGCKDELLEELNNPVMCLPDAIRTPSIERLLKPQAKGYDLPFTALNKEIRGIKPGRIYTICAGEGCGKSSFTKEILFSLINTYKDLKVGAIYLEEPIETTANSFTAIDNNVPLWQLEEDQEALNLLTPKTYDKFIKNHRIEFVDASFMELDGKELEYNIRWLAEGLNCPIIVLDHLTMVTYDMGHDSSERKDIDILMKGLRRLTKETNCSILNVCHLKRPSGKEGWDQGREISLTDLRGSAAIGQLSDVVIGLERNLQNESLKNKTLIKVLKNRIKGSTGHIDTLYYDELTGRLITVDQLFK